MANRAVFCIAKSELQAIDIVDGLKASGFSSGDVSVISTQLLNMPAGTATTLPMEVCSARSRAFSANSW